MFIVAPRKKEWQRSLDGFRIILNEANFNYLQTHKDEIVTKLDKIDAKYGIDQWNDRVTAYYDYLNEIMPEFFDALYGVISDEKIIDKRKEEIDRTLEKALIFDLNVLYRYTRTDTENNYLQKAIFKNIALKPMTIYAQDYIDGYYHAFSFNMLNLIRLYFDEACRLKDYQAYQNAAVTFNVLRWYFAAYSDVDEILATGILPELNWD